ncbi:MAG: hypothetical protein KDC98_25635 [Planctomycetes bacterium]|nr:hypothetical protein [Planctomycetota bacterium]
MPLVPDDIERIRRLRELFLDGSRGSRALRDYWRDEEDLQAYDRVLAARIGWKWDAALAECEARAWRRADADTVLDFGCGTGVAARRFVARFGAGEVLCHDRSAAAMAYAVRALTGVAARALPDVGDATPDVLLVSHVLSELDEHGRELLRALIGRARRVILVESGNRAAARRLAALRDELLPELHVIAPCPHRTACPTLANDVDWCHFFAPPPPEVFTDGDWVRVARELGVDLRALPYAFLALARQPSATPSPPDRVLGRARIRSRDALVTTCTGDGLQTVVIDKRRDAAAFRALRKHPESLRSLG